MRKQFSYIVSTIALCCVLLCAPIARAEENIAKQGATTSLMLRVHYEDMLPMQSLRHQVKELLNTERFMGDSPFGHLYLRNIEGGGISFTAFLPEQHEAIRNLIHSRFPDVEIHQMGDEFTLRFKQDFEKGHADKVMPYVMEILYRRLRGFGVEKPVLSRIGLSHVLVEVPGENEQYVEVFKQLVTRSARLSFLLEDREMSPQEALLRRPHPGSAVFHHYRAGQKIPYLLDVRPVITDGDVYQVETGHDGVEPFVSLQLSQEAAERLEQVTHQNIGRRMAILFENRVYMAPTIMETIRSGQLKITNHFSPAEAAGFAVLLASGSYPVPVEVVDARTEILERDEDTCCTRQIQPFVPSAQKEPEIVTKPKALQQAVKQDKPAQEVVEIKTVETLEVVEQQVEEKPETLQQAVRAETTKATSPDIEQEMLELIEKIHTEETGVVAEAQEPVADVSTEPEVPVIQPEDIAWEEAEETLEVETELQEETVTEAAEVELEEMLTEVAEEPTEEKMAVTDMSVEVREEIEETPMEDLATKTYAKETGPKIEQDDIEWEETSESELIEFAKEPAQQTAEDVQQVSTPSPAQELLEEEVKYFSDDIPEEIVEKIQQEPEVIESLSKFERYLRDAKDINFKIEDATSTPRKMAVSKEILELKISDGL
jgi:protein-export membrane protein SecD